METISETFTISGDKYKIKISERSSNIYDYDIKLCKKVVGPIYYGVDREKADISNIIHRVKLLVEKNMQDDTEKVKERLSDAVESLAESHEEIER